MGTIVKTVAKETRIRFHSPLYGPVEDIVEQSVDRAAGDSAIGSRLDMLTESQAFAQNIVGGLTKTAKFTAPITKLVKRHAELAVMNKAEFFDRSTNVGKEHKEPKSSLPLTGRSLASSNSAKHDEMTKSRKKKKVSHSSGSSCKKFWSSK